MSNSRTGGSADRSQRAPGAARDELETTLTTLARVGMALGAQRVELFSTTDAAHVHLECCWAVTPLDLRDRPATHDELPLGWFPWGLGMIKPNEYVFVQNAGQLPVDPDGARTLAELSVGSTLHIPLVDNASLRGALCVMWVGERRSWSISRYRQVVDLALSALDLAV